MESSIELHSVCDHHGVMGDTCVIYGLSSTSFGTVVVPCGHVASGLHPIYIMFGATRRLITDCNLGLHQLEE